MHCNNTLILYRIVLRYVIIYGSTHYVQMIYICLILSYPILSYHILSYISNDYGYFISYENTDFTYIFYIYISDYANFPMKIWQILRKDPASAFVFGGDLFDRGSGDLRLAEELIQLKRTDRKTWGHSRFFRCKWLIHW